MTTTIKLLEKIKAISLKQSLITLVEEEKIKLGSYSQVARRIGISDGALSTWIAGKYGAEEFAINQKIAVALGYKTSTWQIAKTRDIQSLSYSFGQAKNQGLFLGISDKAGFGKSAAIDYWANNSQPYVFVLRCREWAGGAFLQQLIKLLGIKLPNSGYISIDTKITLICQFFKDRADKKCQLILDEADKLRPSALRCLIPLYNECEDILSVVIVGTENLKKEIENGVKRSRKGYDEIDSRFGRHYHRLNGCTKPDVEAICFANGIIDKEAIAQIWKDIPKVQKLIDEKDIRIVEDMRLLKRLIKIATI